MSTHQEFRQKLAAFKSDDKQHSPLEEFFQSRLESKDKRRALYMPFLTLGDPSLEESVDLACALIDGGADILELGVPFSDPIADGPVIQKALARALDRPEFTIQDALETTGEIHRRKPDVPIVYLTYFNLIFRYGMKEFCQTCQAHGVRGLVIPDLPYDSPEGMELNALGLDYGVDLIYLVTPGTSTERQKDMGSLSRGFVYYVSSYGVTGQRQGFDENLSERVAAVRETMGNPVGVGFGISTPEQARVVGQFADMVIIGSANHSLIEKNLSATPEQRQLILRDYASSIRAVLG